LRVCRPHLFRLTQLTLVDALTAADLADVVERQAHVVPTGLLERWNLPKASLAPDNWMFAPPD